MQRISYTLRHVRCSKCKQPFKTREDVSANHICDACKKKE